MLSKRGKKSQVCFLLVGSGDVWILEKKRNGKKKFGLTYLCIYFNFASSLIWNLLTLSYFSCYYPLCWLPLTLFNKNNYFRVAWCDVFNSILHQLLLFICVHLPSLFPPNHWPEKQFLKGYSEKMIFHLHSIWWKKHFSKYSEMWHSLKINK